MIKILYLSIIIITTFLASYFNWPVFIKGNQVSIYNLIVTVAFFLIWFISCIYIGLKSKKRYIILISVYWGLNILFVTLLLVFNKFEINTTVLLPFAILYGCPIYGFRYFIANLTLLQLITAPLGLTLCILGYWWGYIIRSKN